MNDIEERDEYTDAERAQWERDEMFMAALGFALFIALLLGRA